MPPSMTPAALPALQLTSFVSGLVSPIGMESARDGSGRLFVLEQAGRIRIIRSGAVVATPFLDITAKVASGGELGLLGLAFHPAYASNRKFYVDYTRQAGALWETVIAEYLASAANPDQADAASERILLTVAQPSPTTTAGSWHLARTAFSISRWEMAAAEEIRWATVKIVKRCSAKSFAST